MAINRFKKGIENIKQTDSKHLQNISSNTQYTYDTNNTHVTNNAQDTHVTNNAQDTHVTNNAQDTHVTNNAQDTHATNNAQDTHITNNAQDTHITNNAQDTHATNNTNHTQDTNIANIKYHMHEIQKNQIVLDTIQSTESNYTKNRGKREERYGLLLDKKLKEDLRKLVSAECGRSMNDFIVNILISYVEAPKNQEILKAYDELLKFKIK